MCNKEIRIKGENEFKTYFVKREKQNGLQEALKFVKDCSKEEISKKAGVSVNTINKWDKIMLEKGILVEVGVKYFKKNKISEEVYEITENEYRNHFLDNETVIQIEEDYLDGTITEDEYCTRLKVFGEEFNKKCEYHYLKSSKYAVDTNNELYKEILSYIERMEK